MQLDLHYGLLGSRFLLFVALACAGSTLAGLEAASDDEVPFQLDGPGEIVVPIMLNGTGPVLFMLDTGASHSTISYELAQRLGARAVARTEVVSTIGRDLRAVVLLPQVELGAVKAKGVLASVVPGSGIDRRGRIQGVIGQDLLLTARRYTLDFRRRQLVWHRGPEAVSSQGSVFKLECERGRCLVELPQRDSVLRLVPDSGAEGLVLFRRTDSLAVPVTIAPGHAELMTLTDRRAVRQVRMRELRLGATTLQDVPAALVEPDASGGPPGDGLLPLHPFERVTFDVPHARLIIEHRPSTLR